MTSPTNDFSRIAMLQVRSVEETTQRARKRPPPILDGLVRASELTVFQADPGVEYDEFIYVLAYSIAVAADLGPFKAPKPVGVLACIAAGDENNDMPFLKLLPKFADDNWSLPDLRKHFHIYHRNAENDRPVHLNHEQGQSALLRALDHWPDVRVVILDKLAKRRSPRGKKDDDGWGFDSLLRELQERGIALVAFDEGTKAGANFCDSYMRNRANLVRLTEDEGAPTEIGRGLTIRRKSFDRTSKIPAVVQWWWAVIDDELKIGWEWRDLDGGPSAKEIAMAERRLLVQQYAGQGWAQKAIAAALNIDQATVSRDLAKGPASAPRR